MPGALIHAALGGPDGDTHPGDELDCGRCRAKLLDAFKSSPDVPDDPVFHLPGTPHLMVPDAFTRTVDLNRPDPSGAPHVTSYQVTPFPHLPGGEWVVECVCGWRRRGAWTRAQGPTWATGVADKVAEVHRLRPDETEEP